MSRPELNESLLTLIADMDFSKRLAALRKGRGMTQQVLADAIGVHVSQLRRYEGGSSQPTLEVLRKTAKALAVSADQLLFDDNERSPDEALRLQFEAAAALNPEEKRMLKVLIEGILLKHHASLGDERLAATG